MQTKFRFSESQQFKQWWLWALLLGSFTISIYNYYQMASISVPIGPIVSGLSIVFFALVRLKTSITEAGVEVNFFPLLLSTRRIPWGQIQKAQVIQYNSLKQYGGWGRREHQNSTALNVAGNYGLELQQANGRTLLIGSQQPEQLKAILEQLQTQV
jgi:hypothetical protein